MLSLSWYRVKVTSGARARARAELTEEIKQAARRQMAEVGAGSLSMRQVARDLGLVSSALYRYFASRDELLTALIIEAYDAVGAVAEAAAVDRRGGFRARWLRVTRAIRAWALANPHDYALVYGTPVPGYRAPQDTIPAAQRVSLVALLLIRDGIKAGEIEPGDAISIPRVVRADLSALRDAVLPGVGDDALSRALMAWTMLFGSISYELFGHLHDVIHDYDAFFDLQMGRVADLVANR
jgi:AcrR family transcriptional regulator